MKCNPWYLLMVEARKIFHAFGCTQEKYNLLEVGWTLE